MGMFAIDIGALLIVAVVLYRGGPDRRVGEVRRARVLRVAALAVVALQGLLFLTFALGEMGGGDWSGAGHLIQVALVVMLCWLLWTRPLETGAVLIAGWLVYAGSLLLCRPADPGEVLSLGPLLLAGPQLLGGVLALLAGLVARRS